MPNKLERLLENARKSTNKYWSFNLVKKYEEELQKYLTDHPEKLDYPAVSSLRKEIDRQHNKTSFLFLPEELPPPPDSKQIMALQIPAPAQYKDSQDWGTWIKNLNSYFTVIKCTTSAEKINLLLYLIGPEKRQIIEDYISPATTSDQGYTYENLTEACSKLWGAEDINTKKALADVFQTVQGPESIYEYGMKIKNLCKKANITDAILIVNKFITGLKSTKIKFELLKGNITQFDQALQQATLFESISRDNSSTVNKVSQNQKNKNPKKQNNPKPSTSKDNKTNLECFFCKKPGHIKKNCYNYKKWLNKKTNNDVSGAGTSNDIGSLFQK